MTAKPRTENLTISLTSLYLAWLSTRETINWKEENEDSKKKPGNARGQVDNS